MLQATHLSSAADHSVRPPHASSSAVLQRATAPRLRMNV